MSDYCYQVLLLDLDNPMIVLKYNFLGFDDYILSESQFIAWWPENSNVVVKGLKPTDNIFCPLKPWLLVSEKVKAKFEELEVQGVQFLPLRVFHQKGIEIPGYYVVNILNMVKGLDYQHTTWLSTDKWNVEFPQLEIVKAVLLKDRMQQYDIFRIEEMKTQIFFSRNLKQLIVNDKSIIGFKFLPIKII